MDKQQFATLAIGIKSAYPASGILEDNKSMDFWYAMLEDIPYEIAENAVMEHICTNVYPPNIAEIRKLCMERCQPPVPGFDKAWGMVQGAMAAFGRDRPQEAFGYMGELTASVVKNLGWTNLCTSENPTADRANFREVYEARAKEVQISNRLPKFVAENKMMLQKRYVPVEAKKAPETEQSWAERDVREGLTEEQLAKRARVFEETRRRILGG